jgi:hypothetical protein
MQRKLASAAVLVLACALEAPAQFWPYGKARPGPTEKIAAVIDGKIHTLTKKEISLDREGENVMVFSVGHKTKFLRDGKQADWKSFHAGDEVSIQADEDFPGHFAALTVSTASQPSQ